MKLRGIFSAVVTPVDERLVPDASTAIPFYGSLLARGCDGLNILGTTGEAMSFGVQQRLRFMEALAQTLDVRRLMVGVGAAALTDAAELAQAAQELGYRWLLIIPPFYYRDVEDEGIVRYFAALFSRVAPRPDSVILYNFPRMSGITFHADLIDRLVNEFPEVIAGVKDSSNSRRLELEIAQRQPGLAIFPGSEALLGHARANRLAGCISGSVCLWPQLAAEFWRSGDSEAVRQLQELRAALPAAKLITAVRARIAAYANDPRWRLSVPPLM